MFTPLKGLSKPKGLKGLKGLGKTVKATPVRDLDSGPERIESLVDDELSRLTQVLGDEKLAKRILKLRAKFYATTSGTIPELIIMDFLDRKRIRYEFQKWLFGGRAMRGGQVVDFAIDSGTRVIVIEMQGTYFHSKPGKVGSDAAQRLALASTTIWGKKVVLVEAWERRLLDKNLRDPTLEAALRGQEMGR